MSDPHDRLLEATQRFFKIVAKREPIADEVADMDALVLDYFRREEEDAYCCKKAMRGFACFCAEVKRENKAKGRG